MFRCLKTISLLFSFSFIFAQDEDFEFEFEEEKEKTIVIGAYKHTRLMIGQSSMCIGAHTLDFLISHQFGKVNEGAFNLFGLDAGWIRLGLEYGITDRFMAGFGRNSLGKSYDGFLKYILMNQTKDGLKNNPITLVFFSSTAFSSLDVRNMKNDSVSSTFPKQLVYTHQLIAGRKFSRNLTLQISPTLVHRNIVKTKNYNHDIYAVGFGGRARLTSRMFILGEYYYVLNNIPVTDFTNPLTIGLNIETGGHTFKLYFSNAIGMIEKDFIAATSGSWFNGDIRFGFSFSRVFLLKHEVPGLIY